MVELQQIADNVILGRANKNSPGGQGGEGQPGVKELTEQAIEGGIPVVEILERGLLAGMDVVATRMKCNEMFIPEVLQSARALKEGLALLKPLLAESGVKPKGKMVIGTVQGDVHDIGKSLVGMVVEGAGLEVIDLGIDVSTEKWVALVETERPQILGMSAMLTTTMANMRRVIQALEDAGLRNEVKVIVGGAPVTRSFAHEIGADGYAPDAVAAVDTVRELLVARAS